MSSFAREMAFYTAYHQEARNIWIHVLGVPLITFSVFVPLSWLSLFELGGLPVTAALLVYLYSVQYYLRTDWMFGLSATLLYGALLALAHQIAATGYLNGALVFIAGQALGWSAQIYGHIKFEGNRPAFFENIYQSFISAPLFVIADVYFHLGLRQDLQREIHEELERTGRLRADAPLNKPAAQA